MLVLVGVTTAGAAALFFRDCACPKGDKSPAELAEDTAGLAWDPERRTLTIATGVRSIERPLHIPDKVRLDVEAGAVLSFAAGAHIWTCGPLNLMGTSDQPVVLKAQEAAVGWPGICVRGASEASVWQHAVVLNTFGMAGEKAKSNAGVTFEHSEFSASHVTFEGSRADDALNLVHSNFELSHVTVRSTLRDAIDLDFSEGAIRFSQFEDIGDDALDVGESTASTADMVVNGVHDKAISVGENSILTATDIDIRDVGIGIAAKDGSTVTVTRARIARAGIAALMSYTKDSGKGGASIYATDVTVVETRTDAIAQTGNKIVLNSVEVPARDGSVDALPDNKN